MLQRVSPRQTMFKAFEQSFDETHQLMNECVVQKAEFVFIVKRRNMIDRLDLDYRQLFLYTMRHYREMISKSTKIELKEKKKKLESIKMSKKIDKLA